MPFHAYKFHDVSQEEGRRPSRRFGIVNFCRDEHRRYLPSGDPVYRELLQGLQ